MDGSGSTSQPEPSSTFSNAGQVPMSSPHASPASPPALPRCEDSEDLSLPASVSKAVADLQLCMVDEVATLRREILDLHTENTCLRDVLAEFSGNEVLMERLSSFQASVEGPPTSTHTSPLRSLLGWTMTKASPRAHGGSPPEMALVHMDPAANTDNKAPRCDAYLCKKPQLQLDPSLKASRRRRYTGSTNSGSTSRDSHESEFRTSSSDGQQGNASSAEAADPGIRPSTCQGIITGVEVLPVWAETPSSPTSISLRSVRMQKQSTSEPIYKSEDPVPHLTKLDKTLRRCILSPTSPICVAWDLVFIVVILYDCVMIPLQAFEPREPDIISVLGLATLIFWTLTIPRSFITGHMTEDGRVEMRPCQVVRRYAVTWLCFDLMIVVMDWADEVAAEADLVGSLRILKAWRSLKVLRMMRLARVVKLPFLFEKFDRGRTSQKMLLFFNIMKISFAVLLIAHVIACLWYGLGHAEAEGGQKTWLEATQLQGAPLTDRYTSSLHWAITQFVGSASVHPVSDVERIFSTAVLLFAYVASAGFVSSITASMTRLTVISSHQGTQFATLRRYLRLHHISADLSLRVTHTAIHAVHKQEKNMTEHEVELLALITKPLRAEIHYEVHSPLLMVHPFFRFYHATNREAMQKLCHNGCADVPLSRGDLLFSDGEQPECPNMFFLLDGSLLYLKRGATAPFLKRDGWLCEPALWIPWMHVGGCRGAEHTSLLALIVPKFHAIAIEFPGQIFYPGMYAREYVKYLNSGLDASIIDDLSVEGFDPQGVIKRWEFHNSARRTTFRATALRILK